MPVNKFSTFGLIESNLEISLCMQLCVHSKYHENDHGFPNPIAKVSFVFYYTLASKITRFEWKTMKYFVLGFYQSFLPLVKRVLSFDISW